MTHSNLFHAMLLTGGLALSALLGFLPSAAKAQASQEEPWLLSIGADVAVPVTDSQRAQYLPGAQLSVAVLRPIDPTFAFGARIFVNLHPRDLSDDELLSAESPLAAFADRVVLEITERASLDGVNDVYARVLTLRQLGYWLAIDDLGAGYAGLTSVTRLEPEVVKIDMSLVRGIDRSRAQQHFVASLARVCGELGMIVVTEGVETDAERDTLLSLGCDVLQGYRFGRPTPSFEAPSL